VSINQQTDKALSYGHSNGWVETKKELIEHLESGYMGYNSFREDSIKVEVNGTVAHARFIADINAMMSGKEFTFQLRVLEVWVKKGKRWVLFARQAVRK
jgi:FKBP-type peptidyl-prolyl cis-trans isomerase 2